MKLAVRTRECAVYLAVLISLGCAPGDPSPRERACPTTKPCGESREVCARRTRGHVLLDRDADGVVSDADIPVAGIPVFLDSTRCTQTDDHGNFDLGDVFEPGVVWVRTDSTMKPTLPWQSIEPRDTDLAFLVSPEDSAPPFSFVVASDTHVGILDVTQADQSAALHDAVSATHPTFITVTGDLTGGSSDEQFGDIQESIGSLDVPFVPVPGNHDWADSGPAYQRHFGPITYSFEAGGFHFVVLDYWALLDRDDIRDRHDAFMDLDAALSPKGESTIVLMHAPPRTDLSLDFEQRGVAYLFTGHMHSNRVLEHDGFVEYTTEPLVMGGMDLTPAGYRIATKADDDTLEIRHRATLNRTLAAIVDSVPGAQSSTCEARVTAEVQVPDSAVRLSASVGGREAVELVNQGGWVYQSEVIPDLCSSEPQAVEVRVRRAEDGQELLSVSTETRSMEPPEPVDLSWPQEGGTPSRAGDSEFSASWPERAVWSAPVGGHVHGGGVSAGGGRVFVPVSDLADGSSGGLVALSLTDGARLWEAKLGFRAVGTPALSGDRVLVLSNDGTLHCLAAASGAAMWTRELAAQAPPVERSLYSSPLVADGVVYAGGVHELAAIDIASGRTLWSVEVSTEYADLASHASPAMADGVLVIPFNRQVGLYAFDASTGAVLWTKDGEVTRGIQGTPVIANGTVFVVNETFTVSAFDLKTGEPRWSRTISSDGFYWGYQSAAPPAYGGGKLFVPTTEGEVVAVDTTTGSVAWRYRDDDIGWIRTTHYKSRVPAVSAQPVWTEGRLWLTGADGTLRALDSETGTELWAGDLGTPLVSAPIIQGADVVVADFGGLVRRLHGEAATTP